MSKFPHPFTIPKLTCRIIVKTMEARAAVDDPQSVRRYNFLELGTIGEEAEAASVMGPDGG